MSLGDLGPVHELAYAQDGVLSRRQLLALGCTRWQTKAQLKAGRWKAHGRQTIAVHTGELSAAAWRWYAVFEAGPRSAVDGVSALEAAGLTGWHSDTVRVSVPRGAPAVRRRGLTVRQTRRLKPSDVAPTGLPRVRPEIAAVRAALWARSDRQAATLLAMTVQQGITTAAAVGVALLESNGTSGAASSTASCSTSWAAARPWANSISSACAGVAGYRSRTVR